MGLTYREPYDFIKSFHFCVSTIQFLEIPRKTRDKLYSIKPKRREKEPCKLKIPKEEREEL